MELSDTELVLLRRVVKDVLAEKAFFSMGEMTTITGWSRADVERLASALEAGQRTLTASDTRFLGQSWYAWLVSAKKGRIEASEDDVNIGERFDQRRRAWGHGGS